MSYDLITVGRVNMDLYSLDIGAPFEKVIGDIDEACANAGIDAVREDIEFAD